jgi:hypothetical protein
MLEWKRFFPPPSEEEIKMFEKRIGGYLPPQYRNYLLSENGGQPCQDAGFEIMEGNHKVMLGALYSVSAGGSGLDVEAVYKNLREEMPRGFIPVGEDPGGNQLLLSTQGDDRDSIVFWDRVGLLSKQAGIRLFRVADNIYSFINSLHLIPDN